MRIHQITRSPDPFRSVGYAFRRGHVVRSIIVLFCACITIPLLAQGTRALVPDPPSTCSDCAEWNAPQEPFRLFGNSYYVGPAALAAVLASPSGKKALETGLPTADDPQLGFGPNVMAFAPVHNLRVVADNEVVRVGSLAITPHYTPGHTPGAITWTWQSCEGATCKNMVYADSLSAVS